MRGDEKNRAGGEGTRDDQVVGESRKEKVEKHRDEWEKSRDGWEERR